ncbi:MAG: TIGR01212 family radical SAM protein, partial [Clostridia bacterium]|nr:TIGR01212 family radical SAM protein [Clostridia bacterium]
MPDSPFLYSLDNKRYHTLNYYLKNKYGKRVMRASLDAGFSCPNIDGKCAVGGCTYCISGASEFTEKGSISAQLKKEEERIFKKYGKTPLIAYFQSHSNTYAPLEILKEKYKEALSFPSVIGLSVATRPDCLEKEKIDYLKELSKRTNLSVELGLQTISDETAKKCNRGHNFNTFLKAFSQLKEA